MRRIALPLGPLLLVVVLVAPPPGGMTEGAWRVSGLAAWMALWWLTAVIPLEATALLPLVVLPLLGAVGFSAVAAHYADPIIFLFLGGFLIAAALERWELHRRFAAAALRAAGTDQRRIVLAFMLATAFLSMWISNTATAIMMLPIAAAAVGIERGGAVGERLAEGGLPVAVLLAVAYGASIGGVTTLIGSPPNAILAANARELAGVDVTFASWLPIGLAVAIPMLGVCWWALVTLCRVPRGPRSNPGPVTTALPPLGPGERFVLGVFAGAAVAWVLRTPKVLGAARIPGLTDLVPGLTDAGIAMIAALLLFAVPLRRASRRFALDWDTARHVPWGVLLLFGGGLALAGAFETSGLTTWIGGRLVALRGLPVPVVIGATATLFVFLTELTSNTATAALGMPLLAGAADGLGLPPAQLMLAAALSASMAFMLPVATPPNAIVFGFGALRIGHMARVGIVLNLAAILVITVVVSFG
ncbi:MAG: DASS family sodium-coupled anion symporter, partial [Gemmatimonadota bacterium]|nr:DASS family sodium-coupled anion symporter [Gemmatimonadota bacterium]